MWEDAITFWDLFTNWQDGMIDTFESQVKWPSTKKKIYLFINWQDVMIDTVEIKVANSGNIIIKDMIIDDIIEIKLSDRVPKRKASFDQMTRWYDGYRWEPSARRKRAPMDPTPPQNPSTPPEKIQLCDLMLSYFLATLVALHFTPVSDTVSRS